MISYARCNEAIIDTLIQHNAGSLLGGAWTINVGLRASNRRQTLALRMKTLSRFSGVQQGCVWIDMRKDPARVLLSCAFDLY